MSIKVDCPRCKTLLQVPNKLAGGYVNCPHCKGRLWVDRDAPADAIQADTIVIAPPMAAPPPASAAPALRSELGAMKPLAPPEVANLPPAPAAATPWRVSVPSVSPPAPPVPPPAPAPRKKVARFITAEASDSTLRLAPDGKLPELYLEEGETRQKSDTQTHSLNPLVVLCAICMSVVLCVVLAMIDVDAPQGTRVPQKAAARQAIEDKYFGAGNVETKDLAPYQVLLRDAQRAYGRGDLKTERDNYRKVLDMLRAERGTHEKGLTGSRDRDKTLEAAISVLLSGR